MFYALSQPFAASLTAHCQHTVPASKLASLRPLCAKHQRLALHRWFSSEKETAEAKDPEREPAAATGMEDAEAGGAHMAEKEQADAESELRSQIDELKKELQYSLAERENVRRIMQRDVAKYVSGCFRLVCCAHCV